MLTMRKSLKGRPSYLFQKRKDRSAIPNSNALELRRPKLTLPRSYPDPRPFCSSPRRGPSELPEMYSVSSVSMTDPLGHPLPASPSSPGQMAACSTSMEAKNHQNDDSQYGIMEGVAIKTEIFDDDCLDGLREAPDIPATTPAHNSPKVNRGRGRPRKHPVRDLVKSSPKGRSKTGCFTCRKRKKKCDEAKPACKPIGCYGLPCRDLLIPRIGKNCQKHNVVCEGYPEKTIWKSGNERAAEGNMKLPVSPLSSVSLIMEQCRRYHLFSTPLPCHLFSTPWKLLKIGYSCNITTYV